MLTMPNSLSYSPTPPPHHTIYHAYLVRLWQDGPHAPWRASAQCAQTGEKRLFVDLEALFAFLRTQTTTSETSSETGRQEDRKTVRQ